MTQYTNIVALSVGQANNWTDLGAGPLTVSTAGTFSGVWLVVADAQPATSAVGEVLAVSRHYEGTSHVWALAYSATAVASLIVTRESSGSATIGGTVGVSSLPALPAGTNAIGTVSITGSTGSDATASQPALPVVGANFGAGVYNNYYLTRTVTLTGKFSVEVSNASGSQAVVVRDDATSASGSAPANATVFPLASGTAVGARGDVWSSQTFKGRVSVYSPVTTAITFTAALTSATSGTLSANWAGATSSIYVTFSNASVQLASFTNGSTAVSWPTAVTATASANAATAFIPVAVD